jgi:Fe2+ transport system protein FeoA
LLIYIHREDIMVSGKKKMSLTELKDNQTGIIITILGGEKAAKRLADLGLTPGTEITVTGRTFFSGPVRIDVFGSKLVLGRGLASKIMVKIK